MISVATKAALLTRCDALSADVVAADLSPDEEGPILARTAEAHALIDALTTLPPATTIPGAMPTQPGSPEVMPTSGYYWNAVKNKTQSPALASQSRDWIASHTAAQPHAPRWGIEFARPDMFPTTTAFWLWVSGLGQTELGTVPPPPSQPPPPPPPSGGPTVADLIEADGICVAAIRQVGVDSFEFDADPDPVVVKTSMIDVGLAARCEGRALTFKVFLRHGAAGPWWPWTSQTPITFQVSQAPPWDVWEVSVTTLAVDMNLAEQSVTVTIPALPGPGRRIASIPQLSSAQLLAAAGPGVEIGRSIQGRPILRHMITDVAVTTPKLRLAFHRAGHSNERYRDYFMLGMMQWVNSAAGASARAEAEWYFYLRPSPDTSYHGWSRYSLDQEQNRLMGNLLEDGQEQTIVAGDLLGLGVNYAVDLHTSGSRNGDKFVWGPGSGALAVVNPMAVDGQGWWVATEPETWVNGVDGQPVAYWIHRRLKEWGIFATGMIDTGGIGIPSIAKYTQAGMDFARAFAVALPQLPRP